MKFHDIDYLVVMIALVGISTFVFSLSILFAFEMLGSALIVGGIILLIRRGILRIKRRQFNTRQ